MNKIQTKKQLEIILSKLEAFREPKVSAEQYLTPSDVAAEVIWKALFNYSIENKIVVDLGSGTGILGIGCLLVGAKKVFFIDKDEQATKICKSNIKKLKSEGFIFGQYKIITDDIDNFHEKCDIVIMNPPFGTKKKHSDLIFLQKAFNLSDVVYTFHKSITLEFLSKFTARLGYCIEDRLDFEFMLWNTMGFHTKERHRIKVSCLCLIRKKMG